MTKKNIAIIAGGDSDEEVISLRSATQVYNSIDRKLFNPYIVNMKGRSWTVGSVAVDRNDFSFTDTDGSRVVLQYALIMIHGTPGENGILQGYFELMGIPYSTCDVAVSAVTFDKSLCKKVLAGDPHIHMARQVLLRSCEDIDIKDTIGHIGLPLFVKPNAGGSSFGVSKVKSADELIPAIRKAFEQSDRVMIEEYIQGREVSCGMMVVQDKEYVLPVTELISKNEFFDFEAKYTPGMAQEVTPAELSASVVEALGQATRAVYHTLGCRGVVRVDYIIKEDTPYFIEVNTTPGMSAASIIPQQWRAMGISMTEAFTMIINETINK